MFLTEYVHQQLAKIIRPDDWAIDATVGNGHDTLFLAQHVGAAGQVVGFDLQPVAIDNTRHRLAVNGLAERVQLYQMNHADMLSVLEPAATKHRYSAAIFNLGYLPGSDQLITTSTHSSLQALQAAFQLLAEGGCLSALLYTGHPGGRAETEAIKSWSQTLEPQHADIEHIVPANCKNAPPELLMIQKKGSSE